MAWVDPRVSHWAAQICGEEKIMDQVAAKIAAKATANAAMKTSTPMAATDPTPQKLAAEIKVIKDGTDRLIVSDHPASPYIEFGHANKLPPGYHAHIQWVPGKHFMRKAM